TCYDLNFNDRVEELKSAEFKESEIEELRQSLRILTNGLIVPFSESIDSDVKTVLSLEQFRSVIIAKTKKEEHSAKELLNYAKVILDECRKKGTVQFSRLARLAFIGKSLMKSLVHQKIINQNHFDQYYSSIRTVATTMSDDFKRLMKGEINKEEFLKEYSHLRPGTYDITSPRYEHNIHLVNPAKVSLFSAEKEKCEFSAQKLVEITAALRQEGLQFDAQHFLSFVEKATEAREFSKFEFTKNLSEALELIAQAGEKMGFTRREIALLDINDIFRINATTDLQETSTQWKQLIKEREKERSINQRLVLPSLIFSPEDFDVVQHYQAKPNFITQKDVQSKTVYLNAVSSEHIPDLENSIVILENGDPGYDWIFTRNIAGLITKYGGVASHMSIRCAEFGLPAAIGCGELIFNQIKNAEKVLLNCRENKIIPLGEIKC
ncbi:MAG TPA: PEP-utilizing enzyme, partial [Candidatus Nanoarchaeia archaeon]|nr:PEP-utilizing enzyme [Candidatus Nanoarchaeia archaeon]